MDTYVEELAPEELRLEIRKLLHLMEELDTTPFELELLSRLFEMGKTDLLGACLNSVAYCPVGGADFLSKTSDADTGCDMLELVLPISRDEILEQRVRLKEVAAEIAGQVAKSGTEFEKFSALHEWLMDHIRYGDIPEHIDDIRSLMGRYPKKR